VPTTFELGMPALRIENWYGMVAPGGTPPAIVTALNRITTTALADPAVKEKLAEQGLTTVGNSPEQFRDYIAAETAKWAKVIKDAGIQTTR
jgi:tripartite-type tricarboxylate transporter receptor subunit TctC